MTNNISEIYKFAKKHDLGKQDPEPFFKDLKVVVKNPKLNHQMMFKYGLFFVVTFDKRFFINPDFKYDAFIQNYFSILLELPVVEERDNDFEISDFLTYMRFMRTIKTAIEDKEIIKPLQERFYTLVQINFSASAEAMTKIIAADKSFLNQVGPELKRSASFFHHLVEKNYCLISEVPENVRTNEDFIAFFNDEDRRYFLKNLMNAVFMVGGVFVLNMLVVSLSMLIMACISAVIAAYFVYDYQCSHARENGLALHV